MTLNVSLKKIAFKFVHMDSNIEVVGICIMLSIDHVYILIKRENAIVYNFFLQIFSTISKQFYISMLPDISWTVADPVCAFWIVTLSQN